MKKLSFVLLLFVCLIGFSQDDNRIQKEEITEIIEIDESSETIQFALIEEAPIFPGCKGSRAEKNKCFNRSVQMHIIKQFNGDLAQELNLPPGKKRISIQFIIDDNGDVIDVNSKAPHPKLAEEAERVVKTLPQMTPAKQKNKAVKTLYSIPIIFLVEKPSPVMTKALMKQRKKMERRNKKYGL